MVVLKLVGHSWLIVGSYARYYILYNIGFDDLTIRGGPEKLLGRIYALHIFHVNIDRVSLNLASA